MVAKHFQGEIQFGVIKDEKLAKTIKLKDSGSVVILKPGEKPTIGKGFTSRDSFITWVQQNKKPLWETLTLNNIYSVWQGIKTTFVAFVKGLEEHQSKTVLSVFKTVAKQFGRSNGIEFVIVDAVVYKEFVTGVGLQEEDLPTFAIFQFSGKRQEHFFPKEKQTLNVKNTRRWVESFLAGKLIAEPSGKKDFYSEGDGVVQMTSENINEVVYDNSKDVIVEFYAPWNGHCAALAPHYKAVAERFKSHPSVVVASFDSSKHDPPQKFNVTSLPTILFFPATSSGGTKGNPVPFTSTQRDRNGITQFILANQKSLSVSDVESFQHYFVEVPQEGEDNSDELPTE